MWHTVFCGIYVECINGGYVDNARCIYVVNVVYVKGGMLCVFVV